MSKSSVSLAIRRGANFDRLDHSSLSVKFLTIKLLDKKKRISKTSTDTNTNYFYLGTLKNDKT
jgi:hypothetical protein